MEHDHPQEGGENMARFKIATRAGCSGDLLPPSPPAEKATASQSGEARKGGIGERRYGADLGPANMFNRQFGG